MEIQLAKQLRLLAALGPATILLACPPTAPQGSKAPADPVDQRAKGQPVTAIGVSMGIQSISLARQAAHRRAVASLGRLLEPDAVRFAYSRVGNHATLELKGGARKAPLAETRFEAIDGGWLARATATRSAAAVAAMSALKTVRTATAVRHTNVALALTIAESRAMRAAIERTVPSTKAGLHVEGTLTLVALAQQVEQHGARVSLESHVRVASQRPLAAAQARLVLVAVAKEHLALGERDAALAAATLSADAELIAAVKAQILAPRPKDGK